MGGVEMTGYTKGPWLLDGRTIYALNDEGVNRFYASVQDAHAPAYELNANARLIASAPDLLEALEDMLSGWKYIRSSHGDLYGVGWDRAQDKAIAAIARAKGEE
jgi:hypothetical protein